MLTLELDTYLLLLVYDLGRDIFTSTWFIKGTFCWNTEVNQLTMRNIAGKMCWSVLCQ